MPMAQHKPVNLQAQAHSTNSHRNFPRIFKTQRLQKIILFRQHHFSTCVIYIIIVAIILMNSTISGHWYLRDDGGGRGRWRVSISLMYQRSTTSLPMAQHKAANLQAQAHPTNLIELKPVSGYFKVPNNAENYSVLLT